MMWESHLATGHHTGHRTQNDVRLCHNVYKKDSDAPSWFRVVLKYIYGLRMFSTCVTKHVWMVHTTEPIFLNVLNVKH
jgi:hypothetical protein